MSERRHVDWANLQVSPPRVPELPAAAGLTGLLLAFDEMVAQVDVDSILRHAVRVARERIGLPRVGIYLHDERSGLMRGTWGTNLEGDTVDERNITFDVTVRDREFHDALARAGVFWTVHDDAPLVVHSPSETRMVGRGWVCSTPIRAGRELLGMMFNDAGLTGVAVDDAKQSSTAVLCSLLGTALDVARRRGQSLDTAAAAKCSPVVNKLAALLARDPAMTAEQLGEKLHLSPSRVARLFKAEMGMSLVEYRNRLRLERFSLLLDQSGENLLDAALAAGFGSYAQFHRVFLAQRRVTPGKFLRERSLRQK